MFEVNERVLGPKGGAQLLATSVEIRALAELQHDLLAARV